MKATAVAPSNIAFIKYWGRTDNNLRLPSNPSVSMNLHATTTMTTVEFLKEQAQDVVELFEPGGFSQDEVDRVIRHLDIIRKRAGVTMRAHVATRNSFPKSSGAASSASGFAALTVAAISALALELSEKDMTILARLGSGSACRSIPDGFVVWTGGVTSDESCAYSLYPYTHWNLRDILVIVEKQRKDVSSSRGHDTVTSSPLFSQRLKNIPKRMERVLDGIRQKNIESLGSAIEEDCLDMHRVMQTQRPPLMYWNDATRRIMEEVVNWRKSGLPVYFTIDAGPNVHLICEAHNEQNVLARVHSLAGRGSVIVNRPAPGTRIVSQHLF